MCLDAKLKFQELVVRAGLLWSSATEGFIGASNSVGARYESRRIAFDQPERWRRLTQDDVDAGVRVVRAFTERSELFKAFHDRVVVNTRGIGEAVGI